LRKKKGKKRGERAVFLVSTPRRSPRKKEVHFRFEKKKKKKECGGQNVLCCHDTSRVRERNERGVSVPTGRRKGGEGRGSFFRKGEEGGTGHYLLFLP